MRNLALLCLLAACHCPHVEPLPRGEDKAQATTVLVEVACAWPDEFEPGRRGTGVAISEGYVLTAAHVTACPVMPDVHVTLPDGRRLRVIVDREDATRDVARLAAWSADGFRLGVAPPELAGGTPSNGTLWIGDLYCAATLHGQTCGTRDLYHKGVALDMRTHDGDSGAGVYNDASQLLGIVTGRGVLHDGTVLTLFATAEPSWLEGT